MDNLLKSASMASNKKSDTLYVKLTEICNGVLMLEDSDESGITWDRVKDESFSIAGELILNCTMPRDCSHLFENKQITRVTSGPYFDIFYTQSMCGMFKHCTDLKEVTLTFSDCTYCQSFAQMFLQCYQLVDVRLDFENSVYDAYEMFKDCTKLRNVSYLALPQLEIASSMFNSCENLVTGYVLVGPGIIKMDYTFYKCKQLTNVPFVQNHVMSNGRRANILDAYVYEFNKVGLHLPSLRTAEYAFFGCSRLTSVPDLLGTVNLNDMQSMFYGCNSLTSVYIDNTDNVYTMNSAFTECYNLESLDAKHWSTENVTDMLNMFARCFNLRDIDVSGWNVSNVRQASLMFEECCKLSKINLEGLHFVYCECWDIFKNSVEPMGLPTLDGVVIKYTSSNTPHEIKNNDYEIYTR